MAILKFRQSKRGNRTQRGFLLLETLIAMTIFAIFILFFLASFNHIFATQDESWNRTQASLFAQEGVEISYNIISNTTDWTNLVNSLKKGTVYQVNVDGTPGFIVGSETINEFNRQIFIEPVFRLVNTQEIVEESSTAHESTQYDPETLRVRSIVTWNGRGGFQDVEYITYVTRGVNQ